MAALTGGKLSLFRYARTVGVWRAWEWFSNWQYGGIGVGTPWFDPFDDCHIAIGLAEAVALQNDGRFHIHRDQLTSFLSPELTGLPGYDADQCFRTLSRAVRQYDETSTPYCLLSGPVGVRFELSPVDSDTIAITVLWRRTEGRPDRLNFDI
jgi:hypothetical protein